MNSADVAIIGGGIVGLATAYTLTRQYPDKRITILEKESEPVQHQTGHNSGVLHSGVYYKPGSLKAINCREGKLAMQQFCEEEGIDFDICGKVIVAVEDWELPIMENVYERGQKNGVKCEIIGPERLAELEPHSAGLKAIHVPEAGIIDYAQVGRRLKEIVIENEGQFIGNAEVQGIETGNGEVVLESTAGSHHASYVVNCTGLYSDRVTRMSGAEIDMKIVPFRGEFFKLKPEAKHLCRGLIYPVPDPSVPFLGVHFTKVIDGSIECGPNAVLAFAREGYHRSDINIRDLCETLSYPGFIKLSLKYWKTGAGEMWRSFSKAAFVRALKRLIPEIRSEHLEEAPSGVRAQAISRDGKMVDDFLIEQTERVVNVCNAPSPAATSALNIGKIIVEKLATRFDDA